VDLCPIFKYENFGQICVGLRTGLTGLSDPPSVGYGYGAQLRYRVSRRFNTEFYTDYFKTDILGMGTRYEERIGASLFYYWKTKYHPFAANHYTPFLIAGLGADHDLVNSAYSYSLAYDVMVFSFHGGCGVHYNLTERLDVALEGLYILPIGPYVKTTVIKSDGAEYLFASRSTSFGSGGGISAILSMTFCFGNM
jgi:hypothetical protein